MRALTLTALILGALMLAGLGCGTKHIPSGISLSVMASASPDSIDFHIRFKAGTPGPRALPIAYHSIVLYDSIPAEANILGSVIVLWPDEHGIVTIALPEIDVPRPYVASVAAVDTLGRMGPATISQQYMITVPSDLPPAPDSVVIDTLPDLIEVKVLPESVTVYPGEQIQFCAFGRLRNGVALMLSPVQGETAICDSLFTVYEPDMGLRYGRRPLLWREILSL